MCEIDVRPTKADIVRSLSDAVQEHFDENVLGRLRKQHSCWTILFDVLHLYRVVLNPFAHNIKHDLHGCVGFDASGTRMGPRHLKASIDQRRRNLQK